jgi:hypothetical protein
MAPEVGFGQKSSLLMRSKALLHRVIKRIPQLLARARARQSTGSYFVSLSNGAGESQQKSPYFRHVSTADRQKAVPGKFERVT